VFTANPPLHGPTRQLLAKPFGMKQVAAFDDLVRGVVDKVLAEVAGAGEIDFGFDFTEQVTAGSGRADRPYAIGAAPGRRAGARDDVVLSSCAPLPRRLRPTRPSAPICR
jgi:hypothetical protein